MTKRHSIRGTPLHLVMPTHVAYIALGSNIGSRLFFLRKAIDYLEHHSLISIMKTSSFIETKPVGPVQQGDYLNAVTHITTELTAFDLLDELLTIEGKLGRTRIEKWGPRTIDLDLLFYDDLIINNDPRLTLPHPRLHERLFVLEPLASIAPNLIHPVIGKTIASMLHELSSTNPADSSYPPSPPVASPVSSPT